LHCTVFGQTRGARERERERERGQRTRDRSRERKVETDFEQISSFGAWSGENSGKSFAVSGPEEFFRQEEARDITLTDK
jgi:hypothetical protein